MCHLCRAPGRPIFLDRWHKTQCLLCSCPDPDLWRLLCTAIISRGMLLPFDLLASSLSPVMQEHVYLGHLRDDVPDVLAALLQLEKAIKRNNPRLLETAAEG